MTSSYATSAMRNTLRHAFETNNNQNFIKILPVKHRKCIYTVAAFLLFLGTFGPRTAWGQYQYGSSWTDTDNLQTAINGTSSGGTIYVYGTLGVINQNIAINKNITLAVYNSDNYGLVKITRTAACYIKVNAGYTLTIKNIIVDGNNLNCYMPLFEIHGTMIMQGTEADNTTPNPNNCKIINCVKLNYEGHFTDGAAIHVYEKTNSRLVCNGVTFANNQNRDKHAVSAGLTYGGGALFFGENSSFSLANCVFNNNTAYESGGAILMQYPLNSTIRDCVFNGNNAYLAGGAIYGLMQNGNKLDIQGTTVFENNRVDYNTSVGLQEPKRMGMGGAACLITLASKSSTFNIGTENNSHIVFNNNYASPYSIISILMCYGHL